jgi:hypothetical protein
VVKAFTTGPVVKAFTTGPVVQVFLFARGTPTETWSGNHEQAKEHAFSADGDGQDADRHRKTRHVRSPK